MSPAVSVKSIACYCLWLDMAYFPRFICIIIACCSLLFDISPDLSAEVLSVVAPDSFPSCCEDGGFAATGDTLHDVSRHRYCYDT